MLENPPLVIGYQTEPPVPAYAKVQPEGGQADGLLLLVPGEL